MLLGCLPYGGVAFVIPDGDRQDDAKTAHHKALNAMNFRLKQDSALAHPYRRVGMITEENTRSLVTVLILFCSHSLRLREPNACEALTILDDTSALLLQS